MSKAERIYNQTFSARNFNTSPLSITGLTGDSYDYEVLFWCDPASGDSNLDVTLNADTGTNYRNYEMKGLTSTASAAVGDTDTAIELQNLLGTANTNFLMMRITGSSGDERYIDSFYAADGAILKQGSYWKNTADELDEITFTGASSVTCDAHIIIYRTAKVSNQSEWELIKILSFTTSSSDQTFSSLDGDADIEYKIDVAADFRPKFRLNNDSGSNYTVQYLENAGGSLTSFNYANTSMETAGTGDGKIVTFYTYAESGVVRMCNSSHSNTASRQQSENTYAWSNTADNITSIVITGLASSSGDAYLYKRKNPKKSGSLLPFEAIKSVDISGDYSAGTTISNIEGDNVNVIKVSGNFSTIGAELRIQLEGDTGANYDEQELKASSSTVSASSVSGANYWVLADTSSSKVASFDLYLYPASGDQRPALLVSRTNENQIEYKALWWSNVEAEINSIKVYTSASTTTTGTIQVSRLHNMIPLDSVTLTNLDGTGDYISVADSSSLDTTNCSLSCWVYVDSTQTTGSKILMEKWDTGSNQRTYTLQYDTSDNRIYFLTSTNGTSGRQVDVVNDITDTIVHICCTYDGTDMKIYKNGSEIDTLSASGSLHAGTAGLTIGARSGGSLYTKGEIMLPQIFDSGLTASQVTDLYNSGWPIAFQGLSTTLQDSCALSIEATSRDVTLYDKSGNANNGTANGGLVAGDGAQTINLKLV